MNNQTNIVLGVGLSHRMKQALKCRHPECDWIFAPKLAAKPLMLFLDAIGRQPRVCVEDYKDGIWAYDYALRTSTPLVRVSDRFLATLTESFLDDGEGCVSLDWSGNTHYSGSINGDLVSRINTKRFTDSELISYMEVVNNMRKFSAPLSDYRCDSLIILEDELSDRVRFGGKMYSSISFFSLVKSRHCWGKLFYALDGADGVTVRFKKVMSDKGCGYTELINATDISKYKTVSVLSSDLGFVALLLGVDVHVYGTPFYAGWGLTTDAPDCDLSERVNLVALYGCREKAMAHVLKVVNEMTGIFK